MEKKKSEPHWGCKSESHDNHLCYIVAQGFHLSNQKEYNNLVKNPKFRCNHCGRAANSKQNLCEPVEL